MSRMCTVYKPEGLGSDPQHPHKKLDIAVGIYICNTGRQREKPWTSLPRQPSKLLISMFNKKLCLKRTKVERY